MAFNFPNAPSVGDEYTSAGVTYTWTGLVWMIKVPTGIGEPAADGKAYGRKNGPGVTPAAWIEVATVAALLAAASPVGQVIYYAGAAAPANFLKADGSLVSRTTYAALFAVCQTTYGAGDGSTTFQLPDLRGEFIRGWDDGRGIDASRARGSNQDHSTQSHTHTIAAAGGHTHTLTVAAGGAHTPSGSADAVASHTHTGTTSSDAHTHTGTTAGGGSHAHSLSSPFLTSTGGSTGWTSQGGNYRFVTGSTDTEAAHTHTFTTSSDSHTHTFTTSSAGGHSHALTMDAVAAHAHTATAAAVADHTHVIGSFGTTETRPRNIALLACIKYQ